MNHCVFFTDLALTILEKDQSLATAQDAKGETALHVLARKPSTIANTSQLSIWKRSINSCKSIESTQKSLSKYHVPTLERVGQIRLFWVPLHLGKNTLLICHSTLENPIINDSLGIEITLHTLDSSRVKSVLF